MKTEMSSLDCLAVVRELQGLSGSRVNKIYQVGPQELKVVLNVPGKGKKNLVIEAGKRVHTTDYPKPSPKSPSTFAMTLRKHLGNSILEEVRQHAFDRIIEFVFRTNSKEFVLVAELFGGGNILLLDSDKVVLTVMRPQRYKDRQLLGRRPYQYPPQRLNPLELGLDALGEHLKNSDKDLVRFLAMELGLGGQLAEEVCHRAGVDKGATSLEGKGLEAVHTALDSIFKDIGKVKPKMVMEGEKPVDVIPLELAAYSGMEQKTFDNFMEAADEYFTSFEAERADAKKEDLFQKELGALRARLKDQTRVLKKHIITEREAKIKGDLIYSNFQEVEEILETLHRARKDHSWEDIREIIEAGKERSPAAEMVRAVHPREGAVILELDNERVRLDLRKNASQNAEEYYEKAKKARRKVPHAVSATRETAAKIRRLKEQGRQAVELEEKRPERQVRRKRAWYEKFRWFISSDGFLVLGGRDASSNEVLVKRHMESMDIFVHADIHGAPAVVIKTEGKEVPETTIQEAFDFAASYSRAWRHSVFGLDVYWVKPEQVSKTTEHGEYVTKGAFIIRGKRNLGKGLVGLAVGVKFEDEEKAQAVVIGGPPVPIEEESRYSVRIIPGRMKSQEVAKAIKSRWLEEAREDLRGSIEAVPLEDIQEFLPAGGSDLKE